MYIYSIGDNNIIIMANFAKLNENNKVIKIAHVANDVSTSNGPLGENDKHVDGETYMSNTFGGTWKQFSINNNFRKKSAAIGDIYDADRDMFISPKPYSDFVLDNNGDWQAPDGSKPTSFQYTNPDDAENPHVFTSYVWDSSVQKWKATRTLTDNVTVSWNQATSSWEE